MFAVVLSCLELGCNSQGDSQSTFQTSVLDVRVADFLGGESSIELMQSADEVTAFRMGRRKNDDSPELFHGHPVVSQSVRVEPNHAERLLRVLSDSDSYFWDAGKACTFDPGVGMRFRTKDREVGLVFCFTCDQLLVVSGEHKRMEDTDPARGDLLAIMREIFPHDDLIQKLQ